MKRYTRQDLMQAYYAGSSNTKEGKIVVNFEEFEENLNREISFKTRDLFSQLNEKYRQAVIEAGLADTLNKSYFVNELEFGVIVNLSTATNVEIYQIYSLFKK